MQQSKLIGAVVMVAILVCLLNAYVTGQQGKPAVRPLRVAVVDIAKLFSKLDQKQEMENDLAIMKRRIVGQLAAKDKEILQAKQRRDLHLRGTAAYEAKHYDVELLELERSLWEKFQRKKMARQYGAQMDRLYRKMVKSISDVCIAQGYDLALYKEPVPSLAHAPERASLIIQSRKLIYSTARLDITDTVIVKMNTNPANQAGPNKPQANPKP